MNCRAVLIIEDDVPTQLLLSAIMTRNGLQATIAADGCEALELLATREFDVVLLDLHLPLKHGRDVLREVAASRPHLLERIVIVTGMHPAMYEDCTELERTWTIVRKPFDVVTFEQTLLECLAARVRLEDQSTSYPTDAPIDTADLRRVH